MTPTTEINADKLAEVINRGEEVIERTTNLVKKAAHALTKAYELNSEENREAQKAARKAAYVADNGLTIHKLRELVHANSYMDNEGVQHRGNVHVVHLRRAIMETARGTEFTVTVPSYLRDCYEFSSKGGNTFITITTAYGHVFPLFSVCHENDSFCYKLGVKFAIDSLTDEEIKILTEDPHDDDALVNLMIAEEY